MQIIKTLQSYVKHFLLLFQYGTVVLFLICLSMTSNAQNRIFGYESIMEILKTESPSNVEEFMLRLPENFKSNHVLFHHTQSQDKASVSQPRMIFYNQDASLLMAISGDSSHPRGQFVEMIRFDSQTQKFIPTEVEFGIQGASRFQVRENPAACFKCHGEKSFRPIWRSYDQWPGAFGGVHAGFIPARTWERVTYLRFQAALASGKSPRHQRLVNIPIHVDQYSKRNSELTGLVAVQNIKRVAQLMIQDLKSNPEYIPAVLAALKRYDSESIFKLMPQGWGSRDQFQQRYNKIYNETLVIVKAQEKQKNQLMSKMNGVVSALPFTHNNFEAENINFKTWLRFFEDILFKSKISDWSTTLGSKSFEFTTPTGSFYEDVALYIFHDVNQWYPIEKVLTESGFKSLFNKLNHRTLSVYGHKTTLEAFSGSRKLLLQPLSCSELLKLTP